MESLYVDGYYKILAIVDTEAVIPEDRSLNLNLKLPKDCPTGEVLVKVVVQIKPDPAKRAELYGKGKGKVWMAEDFDAPLEDFAEYM